MVFFLLVTLSAYAMDGIVCISVQNCKYHATGQVYHNIMVMRPTTSISKHSRFNETYYWYNIGIYDGTYFGNITIYIYIYIYIYI